MDHEPRDGHTRENRAAVASHLAGVDTALAAGDVPAALRAWHEAYGATLGTRRWEGFAEAGDAYLRIARASGSPAEDISRARDLYLSALFRASSSGSLEGVLRLASAFVELGDDEAAAHSLRIARRLAAAGGALEAPERVGSLGLRASAPPA